MELLVKVEERKERGTTIETLLVLSMATLHLAVMPWSVRTDKLVADAELSSGILKKRRQMTLAVGKTVGKLKAVVRLHAFHADTAAGIPLVEPL